MELGGEVEAIWRKVRRVWLALSVQRDGGIHHEWLELNGEGLAVEGWTSGNLSQELLVLQGSSLHTGSGGGVLSNTLACLGAEGAAGAGADGGKLGHIDDVHQVDIHTWDVLDNLLQRNENVLGVVFWNVLSSTVAETAQIVTTNPESDDLPVVLEAVGILLQASNQSVDLGWKIGGNGTSDGHVVACV